jgi:putative transcriptional regulator
VSTLKGKLLLATPVIGDPNFERTVILVLDHGDEGTLGLVLNRPTEVAVLDPLPEWGDLAATPSVVFVGGPVEQEAAIALARLRPEGRSAASGLDGPSGETAGPVVDAIGTLDLSRHPLELDDTVEEVRIFAGYSGWGPGQLQAEMESDAWFVVDATADDVLSNHPSELWAAILRRQGGDLALVSYCPPDPSAN